MSKSARLHKLQTGICISLAIAIMCGGSLAGCDSANATPGAPAADKPTVDASSTTITNTPEILATRTDTLTPTTTPTSTTTSTPTLTPTPTPTPLPAEQMELAMRHQCNGQYKLAIAAFQALLDDSTAISLHAESLYRLGQTQLLARDFTSAEKSLQDFLERFPEHAHAGHALVLLGRAQEEQGHLDSAIESLERYAKDHPETRSSIQKWLGDLYKALGDAEQATVAYAKAAETAPHLALSVHYREKVADALLMQEDFAGAIEEYERILDVARIARYRGKIQYLAGLAHLQAEEPDEAAARFRQAIAEDQRSSYAHAALIQLLELDEPVDDFSRGMVDYYNEAYWPAVMAFQRHLETAPDDRPDIAQYYMAASYAAMGMTAEADAGYHQLITEYPDSELFGEAWRGRARLAASAGDVETARELYAEFAEKYPTHPLASHALLSRARLAEHAGHLGQAVEEYLALAEAFPDHANSATALRRAGLGLYRLGHYEEAAETWERLAAAGVSSEITREATFWAGKSRMAEGDTNSAIEHLSHVLAEEPLDYYGQRAVALMQALGEEPAATPTRPAARPSDRREEAEKWLAEWSGVTLEQIQDELPSQLKSHPTLIRAHELMEIGLIDEAEDELDGLRTEFADQPAHLYTLALEFQRWGAARQSILAASRVIALSGEPLTDVPHFLRRLAYPIYFDDLVEAEASEWAVDPLLLYSVIRQESLFQSLASSWAAARGLMQVIPATGEWIAMRLGWPNFSPADLYLPYISVKFGTFYLQQQLSAFDGDVVSALAAYNAGPGNAARWRETAMQHDPDLIYALVDLDETRIYLERILLNRAVYYQTYRLE